MIRTAYPIAPLKQVQLRLELAARRTRRALQARRHDLAALPVEKTVAPATIKNAPAETGAVGTENAALALFYDNYDALTELVCLAAQDGITPTRESRYQAARQWLKNAYKANIKAGLAPYLLPENEPDPFPYFWTPPTLCDLLQNDDGNLICRMEQTQNALAAWEAASRRPRN